MNRLRDFITDMAWHSRFAVPLAGGGTGAVDPKAAGLGGDAGTDPHRRVETVYPQRLRPKAGMRASSSMKSTICTAGFTSIPCFPVHS